MSVTRRRTGWNVIPIWSAGVAAETVVAHEFAR
jgi:hypothetical protein